VPGAIHPVIYGEVLFDKFPDGNVVLGGAPFNVAWHLQAFGQHPLLISRVGNDALGRDIRHWMQEWDMDTSGLQLDSQRPTGTVTVTFQGGEPGFDIVNNCAYDYIEVESIPQVNAALLYHGTLILRNPASAATLVTLRNSLGKPVFLDVNLRPPWWKRNIVEDALNRTGTVKINEDELAELVPEANQLLTRAEYLKQKYGIGRLIVTRGSHGALAVDATGKNFEITPKSGTIEVIDTVGAGDAFASTSILGNLLGWPLGVTMERAQQFASAIVGVRGAVVPDRNFYQPFIKEWNLSAP
jgi:fructokinase